MQQLNSLLKDLQKEARALTIQFLGLSFWEPVDPLCTLSSLADRCVLFSLAGETLLLLSKLLSAFLEPLDGFSSAEQTEACIWIQICDTGLCTL